MYSNDAPSALRNHALALGFLTIYLGSALLLETSSRFMQDPRFSNPPARPGRLRQPFQPVRYVSAHPIS
eukprot:1229511-Pyramimonas_sp.AAC.1